MKRGQGLFPAHFFKKISGMIFCVTPAWKTQHLGGTLLADKNNDFVLLTTPVSSMYGASSGKIFGVSIFNVLEAVLMTGIVLLIITSTPLTGMLKIIASLFYGIPIFAFNIAGIHHEDFIRYSIGLVKRKRKGSKRRLYTPLRSVIEDEKKQNEKVAEVTKRDMKESILWRIAEKLEQ